MKEWVNERVKEGVSKDNGMSESVKKRVQERAKEWVSEGVKH